MVKNNLIDIVVVYAEIDNQHRRQCQLPCGSTILDAITASTYLQRFDIDLAKNKVGIFGKIKPLDTVLQSGDRVEIYRPLQADPKEIRRLKAKKIK